MAVIHTYKWENCRMLWLSIRQYVFQIVEDNGEICCTLLYGILMWE